MNSPVIKKRFYIVGAVKTQRRTEGRDTAQVNLGRATPLPNITKYNILSRVERLHVITEPVTDCISLCELVMVMVMLKDTLAMHKT